MSTDYDFFADWDYIKEVRAWQADEDAREAEELEDYRAEQVAHGDGNPLLGRKDNLR